MDIKRYKFKKKYGQNFLIDNNILNKIVSSANIKDNSLVIEIGVGGASLTKELCKKAKYVIGYEIDEDLKEHIENNLKGYNNYKIIYKDFLKENILEEISNYDYKNLYIVANVPYYITTPIIEKIINSKLETDNIILMVQKEVGDRLSSKPNIKDYGSITVFLNYYYDISKLFVVSRNCFLPKPNVESVVIEMKTKEKIQVKNEEFLFKLIRDAFKYKRKTLRNNLKSYDLEKIEQVLKKYNYDLNVRSECLSINVFCDIANSLSI